ncbi:MAG: IS200/IS605 family transposase [Microcystaceae cyanobacterium]
MATQYRRGRHSVTNLQAHLIFVPKYRRNVFTLESLAILRKSMETVAISMGFEIIEFNGESDHVHLLIEYPPKLSISTLVNHLKGVSSRMYRQHGFKSPHSEHLWSPSYFAVSVGGAPLAVLKEYIKNQKSP